MKHLPNLLTLGNLFCGCIAIAYIFTAYPSIFMSMGDHTNLPTYQVVYGIPQMYMGSIFIGIAALCDLLDGLAARALNVFSPIGKDLDSLADIVSFGVAPSAILFQLLWNATMAGKDNFQTSIYTNDTFEASMLSMTPAFLVACFAALRLAKFNITATNQKSFFIGMPTPAVGLFIATFPLLMWYNPYGISKYFENKGIVYVIIALVCWLMVSKIHFFKLIPSKLNITYAWPQIVLLLIAIMSFIFLQLLTLPIIFITYIIVSFIYKHPDSKKETEIN